MHVKITRFKQKNIIVKTGVLSDNSSQTRLKKNHHLTN